MTLYELTDDYLRLMDMADDPDIDPEVFRDTLDGITDSIEKKADGYARIMKELTARAEMLKAEAERMTARKKAIEESIKRMKNNLTTSMVVTNKRKFSTDLFTFYLQKSTSTVIDDEKAVPDEYMRIKKEPDKTAIKKAIEEGKAIPFAHLEKNEGVRIR
jgi:hypothetical protein